MKLLRLLLNQKLAVLAAFLLVQLGLVWLGLHGANHPMGDIPYAYQPWADFMLQTKIFLGLTQSWVYPFPNLIFVLAPAGVPGLDYQTAWLVLAISINLLAMCVWLFWGSRQTQLRTTAGWFLVTGFALLGPVAVSRLDTISVAVALLGLTAWIEASPKASAVWFAVATWIKVWPFALLATLIASTRNRLALVIYGGAAGLAILLVGLLLGDPRSVLGFVFEQSDRGVQIESPWAMYWLWQGVLQVPGTGLYFDSGLQTFQVQGSGVSTMAALLGPVMFGAISITLALSFLAQRRGDALGITQESWMPKVFAWGSLTFVLDLIVFNKVGSPQYYQWLLIPGLVFAVHRPELWKTVLAWLFCLLGLTGLIYPVVYDAILAADPSATALLLVRNVAAVGLLVLANIRLTNLARA